LFVRRKYKKAKLIEHLKQYGITARGNKSKVQKLAQQHGLPIKEIKPKIEYRWEGEPKGLLQVYWSTDLLICLIVTIYSEKEARYLWSP